MSTPIENNTEELQAILQTVNNLPNAGGGFSIPEIDLIAMGVPDVGIAWDMETSRFKYTLSIDSDTFNELMSKMLNGVVKIKVAEYEEVFEIFTTCSFTKTADGYVYSGRAVAVDPDRRHWLCRIENNMNDIYTLYVSIRYFS